MKNILIIGIVALIAVGGCKKKEAEVIAPKASPTLEVKFSNFPDTTNIRLDKDVTQVIEFTATAGEGIKGIYANMVYDDPQASFSSSTLFLLNKMSGFNSPTKDISVFSFKSPTYNVGVITITVTDVKGQTSTKILTINK
jgi:hypothetical protein